jgi:hypothetical protein
MTFFDPRAASSSPDPSEDPSLGVIDPFDGFSAAEPVATELSYANSATCPDCGAGMVRLGMCFTCPACGFGGCN